jgi:hypothetical protein
LWIPALRFATDGTTNFSTELGGRPRSLSSVFRLQLCFALIRPDRRARFGALPHLGLQSGLRRYIRALGSHFFFNAFLSLDLIRWTTHRCGISKPRLRRSLIIAQLFHSGFD